MNMKCLEGYRSFKKRKGIAGILSSLLAFFFIIGLMSSCDSDEYYYYYYPSGNSYLGVVSDFDGDVSIKLDRGQIIHPQNLPEGRLEDGERVLVTFHVVDKIENTSPVEYNVKLHDYYSVLTKDILEYRDEINDSLGNDPVAIEKAWIRGDYINFTFIFKGGKKDVSHMLNLVQNTQEENDYLSLEFRHNAYDDGEKYTYRGIVSFRLENLINEELLEDENLSKNVRVYYTNFKGDKKYVHLKWQLPDNSGDDEEIDEDDNDVQDAFENMNLK